MFYSQIKQQITAIKELKPANVLSHGNDMNPEMAVSVSQSIYNLTSIGWVALKLGTDVNVSLRRIFNHFPDCLTF